MDVKIPGFAGGDRTSIELPENQKILLREMIKTGKPVVLVLTNGGAVTIPEKGQGLAAILETWYSGQEGGNAVADVIFGKYNPAGRLPVTFYASDSDLPAFGDYSMEGRTYKYFRSKPLYEFGFGLSYTTFDYLKLTADKISATTNDTIHLSLTVKNTGKYDGDEVVQLYMRQPDFLTEQPIKALTGFSRETIRKGETKEIIFEVPVSWLRHWDSQSNDYSIAKGTYIFEAGASSSDIRQKLEIEVK
jgi:beta-glucosidase